MTTIPMDDRTRAFYSGVAAGNQAIEQLNTPELRARPFEKRLGYFWLKVGVAFAQAGFDAEHLEVFVKGATQRKPERRGFLLHIATDNAAFHPQGDGDQEGFNVYEDADSRNREIARILQQTIPAVEMGVESGHLLDGNGQVVGAFETSDS